MEFPNHHNKNMDDGEVEPSSDPAFLQNPSTTNSNTTSKNHHLHNNNNTFLGEEGSASASASVDSLFDELLKHTRTCTHTHTCNPPGPDTAHTHTCYHTHTQVFSSEEDTKTRPSIRPKRPLGNREAVRKYREKKKAHTAFLEEEVKKLRLVNEHLVRKLQGQAALEAEIMKLRALLFDFRGKIDTELGTLLFQNHCNSNTDVSNYRFHCQTQVPCFLTQDQNQCMMSTSDVDKADMSWQQSCQQPVMVDCHHVNGNGNGNENGIVGASDHRLHDMETLVSAKNQS